MARELLTQSKIAAFKQCRRMYFHRHEQHLELRASKPGRRRGHAFGVAIWAALEAGESLDEPGIPVSAGSARQERRPNISSQASMLGSSSDPHDAAQLAIEQAYADFSPSSQEEADEMEFEQHALSCLVSAYLQRYPVRQRRELEYRLPLYNPDGWQSIANPKNPLVYPHSRSKTFDRAGKLDGLEIVREGECRLIEDKLTAQITALKISALTMDMQTCEYVDALMSRGWRVVEVLYRMTRWPSIRRKQGETSAQFQARFSEDLAARKDWYLTETRVIFPADRLQEHRRMRWQVGKDILQARREDSFYQNESRCVSRDFGECEFLPICTGREDAMDLYVTREPNPELEANG